MNNYDKHLFYTIAASFICMFVNFFLAVFNLNCNKENIYAIPENIVRSGNSIEWVCVDCQRKNYLDIQ